MKPSPPTAQQRANLDYVALTSLVLVSWELLVHFFQDLAYLRAKAWYRRPPIWAYFLQRYGAFVVIFAETYVRLGEPSNCRAIGLVALIVGGAIVLPSISLIYLYRVLAIWNKKPAVKYTLIALWVVLFGASITAPFSQSAQNLPTGGCVINRTESYTPASFIANAAYDSLVFVLTLIKLGANRRQYKNFRSPVQTILLRDGILYFAVSVAIGITDIVFLEAIKSKSPAVASTLIPLHVALTSVMTTRLVNNVFHVLTDGSMGTRFLSDTGVGGSGARTNPSGVVSSKIQTSRRWLAVHSTTILVGSGVGTDYFDELQVGMEVQHGNLEDSVMAIRSGKGMTGSQTYAVPMHVRVTKDVSHAV